MKCGENTLHNLVETIKLCKQMNFQIKNGNNQVLISSKKSIQSAVSIYSLSMDILGQSDVLFLPVVARLKSLGTPLVSSGSDLFCDQSHIIFQFYMYSTGHPQRYGMSMNFQIRHRSFLIIGIAEAQQSTFAIRTTLDLKK